MNKDKNLTGHEKEDFSKDHQQRQSGGDTGQQRSADSDDRPAQPPKIRREKDRDQPR